MKKLRLLIVLLFANLLTYAQPSIINDVDSVLLFKYIKLALQNYPLKRASDAAVEKAKANKNIATASIFDLFTAGYFYSPSRSDALVIVPGGQSGSSNIVTRGFQLGVNANLGNLFSKPSIIKGAKADYIIAQEQNKDYNNVLVNNVKAKYYTFLSAKRMLELRTLAAVDLKAVFNNAQTQFKNNEITVEVYTTTKNLLVESEASVLTAEVEFLKAKNDLEDIIGVPVESVR